MTWLTFVISALATYRLSLMLSGEEGPLAIFAKMRRKVPPKTNPGRGIRCLWCWSIWIAGVITIFLWWRLELSWIDAPIYWLSVSGAAIAINQTFTKGDK